MDSSDYYYRDVMDALSDGEQSSSSEEETDERLLADLNRHLNEKDRKTLFEESKEYFSADQIPNCVRMKAPTPSRSSTKNSMSFEDEMNSEIRSHIQAEFLRHFKSETVPEPVPTIIDPKLFEPSTSRTQNDINDELLYDPDADDQDEEWMRTLMKPQNAEASSSSLSSLSNNNKADSEPSSGGDTILNCPCCMTLLCVDCQRHDIYDNQFRAMFVKNCRIDYKQRLTIKNKHNERNKYRKSVQKRMLKDNHNSKKLKTSEIDAVSVHTPAAERENNPESNNESSSSSECDLYYPVHCNNCQTQVALYDCDEVYHFFSVISS